MSWTTPTRASNAHVPVSSEVVDRHLRTDHRIAADRQINPASVAAGDPIRTAPDSFRLQ
jgi:hypothetical protein